MSGEYAVLLLGATMGLVLCLVVWWWAQPLPQPAIQTDPSLRDQLVKVVCEIVQEAREREAARHTFVVSADALRWALRERMPQRCEGCGPAPELVGLVQCVPWLERGRVRWQALAVRPNGANNADAVGGSR